MNPIQPINDWRRRQQAARAGKRATKPDPEGFLTSVGLGVPERLRVPQERAQSDLYVAEATASSLKIEMTSKQRDLALQRNTFFLWFLKIALYLFECGTITYIFVQELGYPLFTAASTAILYTTGTFYLTKSLYKNLCKPRSEWEWHTPLLLLIFLITGASLIVLRLSNRGAEANGLGIDIAGALILAFVTLLPGWPAANYDAELRNTRDLKQTAATISIEYREIQLRVAALREGIDASAPEDFRLIDERERLRAIYQHHHQQLTGGKEPR